MTGHPKDHRKLWLENLIKEKDLRIGAELGVQAGITHLHLLKNCPNLTLIGIDLYHNKNPDKFFAQEKQYKDLMVKLEEYGDRSIFYRESTFKAHRKIDDASLDFVFIDAGHGYDDVKKDITNWMPKIKEDGFIIGHDYTLSSVSKAVKEKLGRVNTGPDMIWWKSCNGSDS